MSLTTFIASWGAALSTFVVARDWWRLRARARVSVGYTALAELLPEQPPFVLTATISNHGRDSIYLAAAGAQTDSGSITTKATSFVDSPLLPYELRPGQSYTGKFRITELEPIGFYGAEPCIRIVFYDQLGRSYASQFIATGHATSVDGSGWSFVLNQVIPSGFFAQWRRSRRISRVH